MLNLLRLAAVVTLVVTGVLLLAGDALSLRTGLALVAFALAAFAASEASWAVPRA